MGANSPAEGELDHVSGENAVKDVFQEKGKEVEKDVHPLAAFLALHGIDGAEDDDEMESEDEEWQPHVRWICTNCIMPNPEDEVYCWKCNEHRNSSILEQGFMSVSSEPKGTFMCGKEKKTAIGYDDRMLLHEETGKSHPERPDRLRAIMGGLQASGLLSGTCFTIPAREATQAELELVHTANHIGAVQATEGQDLSYFTPDTYANEHSALAARLAAGICTDLASAIMTGKAHNGFAAVRPPGHHAEQEQVMGFCLHNNACVAARAAQAAGAKKVLIVDWDVHHGNGTQEIFEQDPTVLYISLHRHEAGAFYPGTGWAHQVGSGPGEGFCVNIPWSCGGIGDGDYLSAFQHVVMPIARQFEPDMTIISAGFDAARGDPLGGCDVTPEGYAQMTFLLSSLSGGRILVVLEGGYNLRSISASAAAVMKVLQGTNPGPLPDDLQPTPVGAAAMLELFMIQRRYWSNLHDATFLKFGALLDSWSKAGERKSSKRRHIGGPIWWKWGRKRVLYDIWLRGQMKHHSSSRHDHSCPCC
uniref:histone deacetylase n=1 Tax=Physcomitrium patens TaxID=3218 RepID=A0A7I4DAD9_PHYPA